MAGSSLIGNLAVLLSMDTTAFEKGANQSQRLLRQTQKQFEAVGSKMQSVGRNMSIALTLPFAALATKGIAEARETAAAMAQVNASLASMGPVAGRTAAQLEKAANAFEKTSLYEADQVLKDVTATMLTFGNVTGPVFDRAQQAAVDLSTKFGKDLAGSAVMVGKALQDPIKGVSALSRVGVSFTAAQKATIASLVETGQVAKAQSLILAELEKQVGGSAAAAQNADPWNKLQDSFNSIAETVGTALIPIIPVLADALATVAEAFSSLSPETQKWVIIAAGAAAALGPLIIVLGTVVSSAGVLLPLILKIGPAFTLLASGMKLLVPVLTAVSRALLVMLANPIILGAALVIGGIYLAWKNWDKIGPIVQRVYSAVKNWILDKLSAVFEGVRKKVAAVTGFFKDMYVAVVGNSYVPDMVTEIGQNMAKLDGLMVAPVKKGTAAVAQSFEELQQRISGIMQRLFPEQTKENQFNKDLADLEAYAKRTKMPIDQLAEAIKRLKEEYDPGLFGTAKPEIDVAAERDRMDARNDNVIDLEMDKVTGNLKTKLGDPVKKTTNDVIESFADMAIGVVGSLKSLSQQLKGGDILGALTTILDTVLKVLTALGNAGVLSLPGAPPTISGARAAGGPVVRGRSYLVGEKGPELFSAGQSGRVISNDNLGGGSKVQIIPSPYFDVVVDGRARRVAAPMAMQAAVMGAGGATTMATRRERQTLR